MATAPLPNKMSISQDLLSDLGTKFDSRKNIDSALRQAARNRNTAFAGASQGAVKAHNDKIKTSVGNTVVEELKVLWLELPEAVRGKSDWDDADQPAVEARVRELASASVDALIAEEKDPLRRPFVKADPTAVYNKTIDAFLGDESIAEFAEGAEKKRKSDQLLMIGLGVGGVVLLGLGIYAMRTPSDAPTL
jgi:hypothetical protein